MEVSAPTWNAAQSSYTFQLQREVPTFVSLPFFFQSATPEVPPIPSPDSLLAFCSSLLDTLLEKSRRWFSTALRKESVIKRLRHERVSRPPTLPEKDGWYTAAWSPDAFEVRSKEFILYWAIQSYQESGPVIPSNFLPPQTPRAQSPVEAPEPQTRTIHIQNTLDANLPEGLIPVQDLPASDLPPLPFYVGDDAETSRREVEKRKIREARLRVALAKLKAERMAEHYYQRYGEEPEGDSDSALSSETASEESFSGHAYP